MEFDDDFHFLLLLTKNIFFAKIGTNDQSYYRFLFKLVNLIMSRFCFCKLVKIPENAPVLRSFFFKEYSS